jgi:hypothetical protein
LRKETVVGEITLPNRFTLAGSGQIKAFHAKETYSSLELTELN